MSRKYRCRDANPKIVKRRYSEDGKIREYYLCKEHSADPDFADFVSETRLESGDIVSE